MNVINESWGREIAPDPLHSALLYYLMSSNSVGEDRNLPVVGPQEHSSLAHGHTPLPDHSLRLSWTV